MRGDAVVGAVGALLAAIERQPGVVEVRRGGAAQRGHVGGKTLVQPQAVPPFHGDQVAEPLVRHFMQDHREQALLLGGGHAAGGQEAGFGEGNGSCVFHRAIDELRHQDLVVLLERVGDAEIVVEVDQAFLRGLEPVRRCDLCCNRLAREQAHRILAAGVLPHLVGAGMQGEVVGAEHRRGREGPLAGGARVLDAGFACRGNDLPFLRRGNIELVGRLQVGLVEQREHLVRRGRFEVRIQVDAAIGLVHVAMQAFTVGVVLALVADADAVAAELQVGAVDGDEPLVVGGRQRLAVDNESADLRLGQVHGKRRDLVIEQEVDLRGRVEGRLAGQREVQHVAHL